MRILIVHGLLAMALVASASAGLVEPIPYAANANVAETAPILVDGAAYSGGDITGYGVRGQYKLNDAWAAFASVGVPEEGLGFAGGAIYALPLDLPVTTAVRCGAGYWSDDSGGVDQTVLDVNAAVVASGALDDVAEGLGWYANVGVHYVKWEAEYSGGIFHKAKDTIDLSDFGLDDLVIPDLDLSGIDLSGIDLSGAGGGVAPTGKVKVDDSEVAMHVGAGLTYDVTDTISAFAGVDIFTGDLIDETFIGGGVRVALGGDAI
ncbi:MAG: hypothetical protein QGH42_04735 [Kiritimatiellia bacterium]|jgi:opacity protein-like surface antigen|nr:hypothetical protein [Kiritimatiellia bacterium]MDP6631277.1 hypothetical protein [Kiritimatiellia bacterium]MDP6809608.1 hypothetical protein [Kiritimatiellia bacterium]MDP7023541.1 hypothetical protein [Kiritimatiellia bacterium]